MVLGCRHVEALVDPRKIVDDPTEWAAIEKAWTERAREMFAATTAGWTPHAVDGFRRVLEDKNVLAGATDAFDFPPNDSPAQPQPNQRNESNNAS